MKNRALSYLLGGIFAVLFGILGFGGNYVNAADCVPKDECKGIALNTCFPIVGNCIESGSGKTDATRAFPVMIGALTKIVMSLILVVCFILIIVAGIMWASDNPGSWKGGGAKGLIAKVSITILLLGFSGVILRLINPNFFG